MMSCEGLVSQYIVSARHVIHHAWDFAVSILVARVCWDCAHKGHSQQLMLNFFLMLQSKRMASTLDK